MIWFVDYKHTLYHRVCLQEYYDRWSVRQHAFQSLQHRHHWNEMISIEINDIMNLFKWVKTTIVPQLFSLFDVDSFCRSVLSLNASTANEMPLNMHNESSITTLASGAP